MADGSRAATSALPLAPRAILSGTAIAALAVLYAPVVRDLVTIWATDSYYSYGFLVPVFSAYVVWQSRARLFGPPLACSPWTWPALAVGLLMLAAGFAADTLTVKALSLPVVIAAAGIFALGAERFRAFAFPVGFLAFMAPLPDGTIARLSLPLQHLAAWVTERALVVLAVPVHREDLALHLPAVTVLVTEACNGLRFLLAMLVLGVATAWSVGTRLPRATAVIVLAIAVALVANWIRVTGTAVIAHIFGPDAAIGFLHIAFGKVVYVAMLVPFLAGVLLVRRARRPAPSAAGR